MGRVGFALAWHELQERLRDRWVLVISMLFALLAWAVGLYGQSAEAEVSKLTGPSLVTLASLLVPLVALVLAHDAIVGERERNTLGLLLSLPVGRFEVVIAKFVGRSIALTLAVVMGLGAAILASGGGDAAGPLFALAGPTLLLGLAFLSIGLLISSCTRRQVTAASAVVITWFCLVFFYDLGLLGLLVVTDGGISQEAITALAVGNPAGLYRLQMMNVFAGPDALADLGLSASLPSGRVIDLLWLAWLVLPTLLSGALLKWRKVA